MRLFGVSLMTAISCGLKEKSKHPSSRYLRFEHPAYLTCCRIEYRRVHYPIHLQPALQDCKHHNSLIPGSPWK